MKLIMGVSADGFVARDDADDMRWLGTNDKKVFRILTGVGGVCAVGRKTYTVMPAVLHGRGLICLSRIEGEGVTLEFVAKDMHHENMWLLGGQTVAMEAFRLGLIEEVHLCRSKRPLGGTGVREELSRYLIEPKMKTTMGDTVVEVYRKDGIRKYIVDVV